MPLKYDLHSHSTASDGTLTPAELTQAAASAGVQVLALTDHDSTAGVEPAAGMALRLGIQLVPGVEISISWNGLTVHLLGLGVDPDNASLQTGLAGLREYRSWRAEEIGRRLEKSGIPGAYAGACKRAGGNLIARTHFARFLLDEGYKPTLRKIFQHFLVRGKPGYVPGRWAVLEDAVDWVRQAGGQAVIAHPARYRLTRTRLRRLLSEFKELGGVGLEVVSGSHSLEENRIMAGYAIEFGLLVSAGSDYHGPGNPWVELGRLPRFPDGVTPIWDSWNIGGAQLRTG